WALDFLGLCRDRLRLARRAGRHGATTRKARGRVVPPARCHTLLGRMFRGLLLDDREQVASGEHQVLLTVVLDLGAAVLAVEDDVALLDVQRDALVALVVPAARAHGQDLALLRLLLGGV